MAQQSTIPKDVPDIRSTPSSIELPDDITSPSETEYANCADPKFSLSPRLSVSTEVVQNVEQSQNEVGEQLHSASSGLAWSSFGPWEKKFIVMIASLGAFFSPLTTMIYFPALNDMAMDLHVSIAQINLTITAYMIFRGIAPSFIGPFADSGGRRPAYVVGFLIYIASNIALALNKTYAGLMVLRCIQSCVSSGMVTLKTAIIADVVTSAERGSYIAFTQLGSVLGPSVGPIAGGLIAQNLGWHWLFWFLVIISTAFFIPLIAFFPETCRAVVGDGSLPPANWNKSLLNLYNERKRRKSGVSSPSRCDTKSGSSKHRRYPNPWSTVRLMAEKETALILLFGALLYAGFYAITTTITTQFHTIYHLSPTFTGLLFLPLAAGSICAALTNGKLLDPNYHRHAHRLGLQVDKTKQSVPAGIPIERIRLEIGIPLFCASSLFIIIYGWLLQYQVHVAGPIVLLFLAGYTALAGFSTMSVLLIDIHRTQPATASAASNLTRCLLGAGSSAVVNPMIEAMGNGFCFTFIGLILLFSIPILWVVIRLGPGWRKEKDVEVKQRASLRVNEGVREN